MGTTFNYQGGSISGVVEVGSGTLQLGMGPLSPATIRTLGNATAGGRAFWDHRLGPRGSNRGQRTHKRDRVYEPRHNYPRLRATGGGQRHHHQRIGRNDHSTNDRGVHDSVYSGNFLNRGQITVGSNTGLEIRQMPPSTPAWFEQQSGSISLSGSMTVVGGKLDYTGGTLDSVAYESGPVSHRFIVRGTMVSVAETVTSAETIECQANGNTLVGNLSHDVTLRVTAGPTLATLLGAENAGTISLVTNTGPANAQLQTTNGLVNRPDGVITTGFGTGTGAQDLWRSPDKPGTISGFHECHPHGGGHLRGRRRLGRGTG